MVTVFLNKAIICFSAMCYPALIGERTAEGEYTIVKREVVSGGYGGDVLQYNEDDDTVYAIHRVWEGNPEQSRRQRLNGDNEELRKGVTNGCINVDERVYEMLLNCCQGKKLIIVQ